MQRGSLFACLRDPNVNITPEIRTKFALDVARGMAFLHASNLLHRDLKSMNVLVSANWVCKVGDLGQTRAVGVCNVSPRAYSDRAALRFKWLGRCYGLRLSCFEKMAATRRRSTFIASGSLCGNFSQEKLHMRPTKTFQLLSEQ